MSNKEYVASIKNMTSEELMEWLQYCGHDGYYNVFYYPIIKEIRKRLSSKSELKKRKKGEWIEDSDPGQIIGEHYRCSICHVSFGNIKSNFCPNCGAEMTRGENE